MKQEKQQEIALMRYRTIAPLIAGLDENYPSKSAFTRKSLQKEFSDLMENFTIMPPLPSKNGI